MELEFQNTREDYLNFYKTYLKNDLKKKAPYFGLLLLIFLLTFCAYEPSITKACLGILSCAAFVSFVYYFIPYWISIYRLNKAMANNSAYGERRKMIITEEGLIGKDSNSEVVRSWESIKLAEINDAGVYIQLIDKTLLFISNSNFSSKVDALNFLGVLNSHLSKGRYIASRSQSNLNNNKPPYLLGLLGFIPLVGAFVGIGLILCGFLKYKDRKLILIGAAGVVFSIAVYATLYFSFNSDVVRSQFAAVDTIMLNDIVKEVEFYKIQHNRYPDSLEQLETNGGIVSIYDPLFQGNVKFSYRKIGDKYTLYSSGSDGKPGTGDDIYPTIKIDTTGKIGLIKNQ